MNLYIVIKKGEKNDPFFFFMNSKEGCEMDQIKHFGTNINSTNVFSYLNKVSNVNDSSQSIKKGITMIRWNIGQRTRQRK